MNVTWAVARQMMAECIRMKIALVFLVLLAMLVVGLPFSIEEESPVTDAVQAFLSYSLSGTGALLGILTIFLSRSLADELVNRQILMVMAKPVPRWQYVLGKWLGMCLLNGMFLLFSAVVILGLVYGIRAFHPPLEELDAAKLENEVLVSRATSASQLPNFRRVAEAEFERRREQGSYDDVLDFNKERELARLTDKAHGRWRTVGPLETREFEFQNVLCARSADNRIQLRYKAEVFNYPLDEIFRSIWRFGDPAQGTPLYEFWPRHVVGRYHTIDVPADAVAPDHTLRAVIYNRNPNEQEPQFRNVLDIRPEDGVEVRFVVGSFVGNFTRVIILMLCKLMFLAAVALLATTLFSFPVACLASFTVYVLAGTRGFILESLDFASADQATWFSSLKEFFVHLIAWIYTFVGAVLPDFASYNGIENLVDGRNVSLIWVLQGVVLVALLRTGVLLGAAMLFFQRREVSEVSV